MERPAGALPRAIILDLDGTLLTDDHEITDRTVAAVRAAGARGVPVVLASSRPPEAMLRYLGRLQLPDGAVFVSLQGALVCAWRAGAVEIRRRTPLDLLAARSVVAAAAEVGLATNWYRDLEWRASAFDTAVRHEAAIVGFNPMIADLLQESEPPQKLLVIDLDPSRAALSRLIRALPAGVAAATSSGGYLEVVRAGVDKAVAARAVTSNCTDGQGLVAIGDGENDLGLLRAVGCAIAMANASDSVRNAAAWTTASNNDDGVAAAIETLLRQAS